MRQADSDRIKQLRSGETVSFRPVGNSMVPKIYSGDLVVIAPIAPDNPIEKNDILYCKVRGNIYVHLVTAIKPGMVQISNNKGHVNGWTSLSNIYGRVISIQS